MEATGTLTFSGTGEMKYQWASSLYPWWSSREKIKTLIINEGITRITSAAFAGCSSLTSVNSYVEEPFEISANVFPSSIYTTATLYVPKGTKAKYEATAAWNQFQNIVEIEATGVEPATATATTAEPAETYSLDGRRAAGPRKGLSIVKMSDGTVKKVLK